MKGKQSIIRTIGNAQTMGTKAYGSLAAFMQLTKTMSVYLQTL